MLELIKLHFLEFEQTKTLGEIVVLRPEDKPFTGLPADLPLSPEEAPPAKEVQPAVAAAGDP